MFDLALYSGHNTSFTLSRDGEILEVLELERWLNVKNISLMWYEPNTFNPMYAIPEILNYFKVKYGADEFEHIICNQDDTEIYKNYGGILKLYNGKRLIETKHQMGHAMNVFYQTDLENAYIVSFDGGGNDGCFNFYKADRTNGVQFIRANKEYNIGEKYAQFGFYCDDLSPQDRFQGYLVHAGKLMGLSGYGDILRNDLAAFFNFYKGHHDTFEDKHRNYEVLKNKLRWPDRLAGKLQHDVARTSQHVFEQLFASLSKDEIDKSDNNLCLAGGCALNVLNNTEVYKKTKTYVSPNPDDRGLSLGFMLGHLQPKAAFDSTYIGPEAWDRHLLYEYVHKYNGVPLDMKRLAEDINNGKIIGVVRGRSEHGARALGNRSILCSPKMGMKDTLNAKVKHREYYRPFAPVVRREEISKYFQWNDDARWMSYSPKINSEWRQHIASVVHIDDTARVQTVTEQQNEFLYELLTELDSLTGIGIVLNTSFNIAGKPILNTYRDAVWMLENVELDGLVLDGFYLSKKL